jgi:hypothetical protein
LLAWHWQVLEEGSDWRGRAQRIHILKDRLLNLHETLHAQVGVMFVHLVTTMHVLHSLKAEVCMFVVR